MNENSNKMLIYQYCPHCSKKMLIKLESFYPIVKGIITEDQIKETKNKIKEGVEKLDITLEGKEKAIKWVDDEETIIDPEDVEKIIKDIQEAEK